MILSLCFPHELLMILENILKVSVEYLRKTITIV
jgi:hypothetical protein